MHNSAVFLKIAKGLLCLLIAALLISPGSAQAASGGEQIFFSKSFPGSLPAYFEVEILSSGEGRYREAPDEEEPIEFVLSPGETEQIFGLVRSLDFSKDLKSKKKVAFTGKKLLRYRGSNGETLEAEFIYSEDPSARAVAEWFEKVAETEKHLMELERTARFDRLGVNKALLLFQASFEKDRIIAPQQFLPILKKIANGKKFLHIARARAASLVERIEKGG